jgi:hypothetical protein
MGKEMDDETDEAGEAREEEKSKSDPSMVPFKFLPRMNCL